MKRAELIVLCFGLLVMSCNEETENKKDFIECDSTIVQPVCITEDAYEACVLGHLRAVFCNANERCESGRCVPNVWHGFSECDSSYVRHCENDSLYNCVDGKIYSVLCVNGCRDRICISSSNVNPMPGQSTPGQSTPEQPTPGQPTPGQPTPGQPTPATPECDLGYSVHCEGNVALSCINGMINRRNCVYGCDDGQCKVNVNPSEPQPQKPDCDVNYVTHCENNVLLSCMDGAIVRRECMYGCYGTACLPDQEKPEPTPDECDGQYKVHCEDDALFSCSGGKIIRTECPFGCLDGVCQKETDHPIDDSGCGNYRIDNGEVCDGTNIGNATCYNVNGADPKAGYSGKPSCNNTCTALTWGTCQTSTCGNGWIEPEYGEICESGEDYVDFVGKDYTCSDYLKGNYQWQADGRPGCSSDCKGLSKGTCKLAPQPIAGLEQCQFDSLARDKETGLAVALATVMTESDVDGDKVTGRLVCTLHIDNNDAKTYTWSLKGEAEKTLCSGCTKDEYQLIAEINTSSWPGGTYDCAFLVNAQGGMNSYYICSTTLGYPVPQEDVPDASQIRTMTIESEKIEGTVLAHWSFSAYNKGDVTKSVVADDGVLAAQSMMSLSTGGTINMLSGPSGNPEAAASSNDWAVASSMNFAFKHFLFSVSTSGYKNIRFQFKVAGSGIAKKHIQLAYKIGDIENVAGDEFVFDAKNEYQNFPLTVLPGTDNQNRFEIRIYPYGEGFEKNTTVRVDDIYLVGDPI